MQISGKGSIRHRALFQKIENVRYDPKILKDWEFSFRQSLENSVQAFEKQTLIAIIAVGGEAFCIDMFLGALSFEHAKAINCPLFAFPSFQAATNEIKHGISVSTGSRWSTKSA
jgi:hypothetical protein